jgi:hypothetical protein
MGAQAGAEKGLGARATHAAARVDLDAAALDLLDKVARLVSDEVVVAF